MIREYIQKTPDIPLLKELSKELEFSFTETLYPNTVVGKNLAHTYAIRKRILNQKDLRHGGFEQSVSALRERADNPIKMLSVDTPQNFWLCFINECDDRLIGCLFVEQRKDNREALQLPE